MFHYLIKDYEHSHMPIPVYRWENAVGCPIPDGYLNKRPVYFGDRHLDGCDSFFESAHYADTDVALDENELDQLTGDYADYLVEACLEHFGYFKK